MIPFVYNATVLRVIDGDSIEVDIDLGFHMWLKEQNIRLKNIDAPETRTRDLIEKQFGFLAKGVVEELCPVGSHVLLRTDFSDHDKFGRILGIVMAKDNTINVNGYLLGNHYATDYEGQNKAEIKEAHLRNRQILIENGKITVDYDV